MSKSPKVFTPPLSRPVMVGTIPGTGLDMTVEPTVEECVAIARALKLASVDKLHATLRLAPRAGGLIAVSGELFADTHPICVVSLEPFPLRVRDKIDITFADAEAAAKRLKKLELAEDAIDDDPPDLIENGIIDAGQVVMEFLALAMPLYPRKPGAAFEGIGETEEPSPFAALKALKGEK